MTDRGGNAAVIRFRGVARRYIMGEQVVNALDGVDVEIARNEYVAIVGASGSGKSTMMNIIGCLDRPTEGEYWLEGANVSEMDELELARVLILQERPEEALPHARRSVEFQPNHTPSRQMLADLERAFGG